MCGGDLLGNYRDAHGELVNKKISCTISQDTFMESFDTFVTNAPAACNHVYIIDAHIAVLSP